MAIRTTTTVIITMATSITTTSRRALLTGVLSAALVPLICTRALAQASSAEIALYEGADRTQKLIEGAKKEGTVTLYASAPNDDLSALASAFEKKYGVKVQHLARQLRECLAARRRRGARGPRRRRRVRDQRHRDGIAAQRKSPAGGEVPAAGRHRTGRAAAAPRMGRHPHQRFRRRLQHQACEEDRSCRRPTTISSIRAGRASSASRPTTPTGSRPSSRISARTKA